MARDLIFLNIIFNFYSLEKIQLYSFMVGQFLLPGPNMASGWIYDGLAKIHDQTYHPESISEMVRLDSAHFRGKTTWQSGYFDKIFAKDAQAV